MKTLKSLCAALMDTAIGLLTFNLPMNRVPHSNSSSKLVVAVTAIGSILEASLGNVFPALLMALTGTVVAIDHAHREAHVPHLSDQPSRVIAIAYVIGMTSILSSITMLVAGVVLPEGVEGWVHGVTSVWMVLVLVTMLPSIERHQAELVAAASALSNKPTVAGSKPAGDAPESKQP